MSTIGCRAMCSGNPIKTSFFTKFVNQNVPLECDGGQKIEIKGKNWPNFSKDWLQHFLQHRPPDWRLLPMDWDLIQPV